MKRVVFSLANGVDGEIVLADNYFTEFWCMVFQKHISSIPIRKNNHNPDFVLGNSSDRDRSTGPEYYQKPEVISRKQDYISRVNSSIDYILSRGINWTSGHLPADPDFSDLNRIHRGFTTMCLTQATTCHVEMTHEELYRHKLQLFNMNLNYAWPYFFPGKAEQYTHPKVSQAEKDVVWHHLHQINAYVHRIENSSIYNPRKGIYNETVMSQYPEHIHGVIGHKLDWDAKMEDGCTDSQKLDWNYASGYGPAVRSTQDWDLNVYDLKNILGKDYHTCYIDHDDPFNFDITNTVGTTKGGFEIRPGYELFHKKIINPWLESWGFKLTPKLTRPIPIGRIDPEFITEHLTIDSQSDRKERLIDLRMVSVDLIS